MKTATGVCKFCGQNAVLEVPEEFTQEEIATAEGMIRDFFEDREGMQAVKDILLSAVEPLARSEIGSISISKNGYTGSMKPTKDGIKVSLKYTTVESVES